MRATTTLWIAVKPHVTDACAGVAAADVPLAAASAAAITMPTAPAREGRAGMRPAYPAECAQRAERRCRAVSAMEGGIAPSRGRLRHNQMLGTIHGAPKSTGSAHTHHGSTVF
jgi:hypothetical protein